MTRTRILHMICIAVGALIVVLFLHFGHRGFPDGLPMVSSATTTIAVSLADTEPLRQKGLSGTSSLPPSTGKLFVFETPGKYGFWMKDMHYALDVVWIDKDWGVVGVTENITPETYPEVFYPPSDVRYVLELNAREAAVDNITVGTRLLFRR